MKSFRRAIRWWILIPFTPILIAIIAGYWATVFHLLGLYRLQRAADAVVFLDFLLALPYVILDFLIFKGGKTSSDMMLLLRLSFFAIFFCLVFYAVTLMVQTLDRRFGHAFHVRLRITDDVITGGTLVGAAFGMVSLALWLLEHVRAANFVSQAAFAIGGVLLLGFAATLAIFGRRWMKQLHN